jgi:hypothetical protein
MNWKKTCKKVPWIAILVTALPIGWFIFSLIAFIGYMVIPKRDGKVTPRYVSAFSALYSGIICLFLTADYWLYFRSPYTKYHLYRLSVPQKAFLVIRLCVAVTLAVVAIVFTILFGVLFKQYIAEIVWTAFAIAFCALWIAVYLVQFVVQRRRPLLMDDTDNVNTATSPIESKDSEIPDVSMTIE